MTPERGLVRQERNNSKRGEDDIRSERGGRQLVSDGEDDDDYYGNGYHHRQGRYDQEEPIRSSQDKSKKNAAILDGIRSGITTIKCNDFATSNHESTLQESSDSNNDTTTRTKENDFKNATILDPPGDIRPLVRTEMTQELHGEEERGRRSDGHAADKILFISTKKNCNKSPLTGATIPQDDNSDNGCTSNSTTCSNGIPAEATSTVTTTTTAVTQPRKKIHSNPIVVSRRARTEILNIVSGLVEEDRKIDFETISKITLS